MIHDVDDPRRLEEKLRAIEALYAGATTPGEREAAGRARARILAKLSREHPHDRTRATDDAHDDAHDIEWEFRTDAWTRRVLLALAYRYGLEPYRYQGQRRSTVVLSAPEPFFRDVFLPQYDRLVAVLTTQLTAVTDQVVTEVLSQGSRRG